MSATAKPLDKPSCENCVHMSISLADKNSAGQMICRSRPPVPGVVSVPTQQGLSVQVLTLWPVISKNDICGEYDDGTEIDFESSDGNSDH